MLGVTQTTLTDTMQPAIDQSGRRQFPLWRHMPIHYKSGRMQADSDASAVRLDRWLWAARAFRSRSLAADACNGGKVELNGGSAKAHKLVRPGDLIAITTPDGERKLRVLATSVRRGSASVARNLYEDLTPPPPPRQVKPAVAERERGLGRPTKRERRDIDRWRDRF
jgi:ribosome-associated heat shock protein Hsp15